MLDRDVVLGGSSGLKWSQSKAARITGSSHQIKSAREKPPHHPTPPSGLTWYSPWRAPCRPPPAAWSCTQPSSPPPAQACAHRTETILKRLRTEQRVETWGGCSQTPWRKHKVPLPVSWGICPPLPVHFPSSSRLEWPHTRPGHKHNRSRLSKSDQGTIWEGQETEHRKQ